MSYPKILYPAYYHPPAIVRPALTQPCAIVRLALTLPCATAHQPQLTNRTSPTAAQQPAKAEAQRDLDYDVSINYFCKACLG